MSKICSLAIKHGNGLFPSMDDFPAKTPWIEDSQLQCFMTTGYPSSWFDFEQCLKIIHRFSVQTSLETSVSMGRSGKTFAFLGRNCLDYLDSWGRWDCPLLSGRAWKSHAAIYDLAMMIIWFNMRDKRHTVEEYHINLLGNGIPWS